MADKPPIPIHLTKTERRLLQALSDGLRHERKELLHSVWDEFTDRITMRSVICTLRKKLRTINHDIICETGARKFYYRYICVTPIPYAV